MSDKQIREDLKPAVQGLLESVQTVQSDDLSALAKMHGWAGGIALSTGEEGEWPFPPLKELIGTVTELLEGLILGESQTPDEDLAKIQELVNTQLETLAVQASETSGTPSVSEGTDSAPAEGAASVSVASDETSKTVASENQQIDAQAEAMVSDVEGNSGSNDESTGFQSEPLIIDQKEEEFVKAFVEEAAEHIEAIEAAVLEVERDPNNAQLIDDLFRPFHTIKGMAGFLNLRDINCLTHEAETLMDQARKGNRTVDGGVIDIIFDVVDILKTQVNAIAQYLNNPDGSEVNQPPVASMICKLQAVIAGEQIPEGRQPNAGSADKKVGENLVEQGAVASEVVDYALEKQKTAEEEKKVGEILIEDKAVSPRQVSQAIRPQTQTQKPAAKAQGSGGQVGDTSVRIDTQKLDSLVDMVGELVIAQTQVAANHQIASDEKLSKDVGHVSKIVRDVQEVAMGMRMVPIGPTFQKMARLVRDVSRKAGKTVDLVISGEDTELDKNVIQQIGDPLVHMVRNAIDHGIESPEDRDASGKSATGKVNLLAYHQGGNIVIEITDDGKGLDAEKLIQKAIERGIVQPGEELSDQQAFGLIFEPGFSTAAQITDISGRGVGMDVVKRNIEQLRGKVEILSEKGKGSTFLIRLPLTLAIIDGMVVNVGSERFIIQTITIDQSLRPTREQIHTVQHRGEMLNVRGRLLPLVQMSEMFGLGTWTNPCDAMVIVVKTEIGDYGLIVDELVGQQQVVIKALGEKFKKLRGISGGAILGDGRVGLIIEPTGLAEMHKEYFGGERDYSTPSEELTSELQVEATDFEYETQGAYECESAVLDGAEAIDCSPA